MESCGQCASASALPLALHFKCPVVGRGGGGSHRDNFYFPSPILKNPESMHTKIQTKQQTNSAHTSFCMVKLNHPRRKDQEENHMF